MRKIISLVIAISMLSVIATGCMGKNQDNNLPKIGVCLYKYDDTYISTVRQALEQGFKNKATLYLNDGKGDQGTQNDQVDLLIQKNVDVLLVNIVDVGAAQTIVDKAKNADIPILFFNREPDQSVIKSYDKARFVGTNAKDAGVIQGEIITKTWSSGEYDTNKDGVMQYVMLKGEPDNPEAVARSEWSIKTAEENGIKTEELGIQVCNWDTETANRAMEAWLSKFGDKIEFVVSNNDSMAQGAIAALQASNYNKGGDSKHIPVVGVDATDAAKDLIAKGYMTGSVLQDGQAMSNALIAIALNAYNKKEFIENTEYEYDATGIAVRIPYKPYEGTEK
ncbi:MAG: galactose ABC transporter substrate-binding protein [Eubacteriales bacterium]|nr:galactose ABC transporter substrate-binding protein [Eubacteriales bacterium]